MFMVGNLSYLPDNENTGTAENTEKTQEQLSSNNEKQSESQNNVNEQPQEAQRENQEQIFIIYSYDAFGNRTSKSTRIARPELN